ncbi:uncharacterized protein HD556DRAFT_1437631 [Suillus plorans]|uniref:Uncharacterized protein n=1 Tax=Suillus plorans TaxID=116603 RepID=A0A9P7DVA3_9AGAM|nr:uncharacterized protein HD556DRAFT_1437631 [Suillus plorans]KAG1803895.1 hypothetical protein HD556DRAFT_1437631 [Suillus plorans]
MGRRKRNSESSANERPTVKELRAKMDKRPVEANTPTNDPAHATQKMGMELAKCRLGVAYIDIFKIQNPLLFGKYNDRPQVEREVNKLLASFKKEGLLVMREDTAIPIIVSSTRLKSGLQLALNFNEEEVPPLQLKDAHTIVVASGQHHVAALKKYSKNILDEITAVEKCCHKINEMKNPSGEHIAEYNRLHSELGELRGALILMGKWGVIIYDEDTVLAGGDTLANHLSRNKSLHEYKETSKELFSGILRLIKAAYKNAPEEERVAAAWGELQLQRDNMERQKNTRLTKILSYEKLVLTLAIDLLPLGSHFRRCREFHITWLARSIDVVMGMFIQFIQFHTHILRLLASNDAFPDYATVSDTIAATYDEESGCDEAVTKLEEWHQMIYDSVANPDTAIFNDVFDDMSIQVDDQFKNIPLKDIGTQAPSYTTSLDNYSNYLVRKLRSQWHLSRTTPTQWNTIAKFHDRVTARIAVWLTPEDGAQEAPFPLLCGHVLDIAWSMLASNSAAFEEISGWFEPLLLHYHTLHRHSHLMDDKTEVMFTNLRNDPRMVESEKIEEAVFTCLWALRTTMVLRLQNNLTTAITCSQWRKPFKDRKEVDEKFAKLGSGSKDGLKKLQSVMTLRKGRGRDLTTELQVTLGILALHVTSWDWNNRTSKNSKRDMEPFIKAILLDLGRDCNRREDLFHDPMVAGLQKTLEDVIAKHTKAINMAGENGRTIKRKRWVWYDGAEIPSDVAPTVTASLMVDEHVKDAHIHRYHELEERDRAAIVNLILYVKHMAGAQATSSTHSPMAANVVRGLRTLIHELEINCTRLRIRALEGDDSILYNIKDTVDLMIPAIQGIEDQHTIDEPEDEQARLPASTAPVMMQAHETQSQILTTKLVKSQQPRSGPDAHGEPPNLSVDNSAPTSHSTSTLDATRTLQTKDEGKASAGTGTEGPVGEWGKGDGSTDGMVTGMKPDLGEEGGGPGDRCTADAAAAVVSCEGAHIDIDQRHKSSGIEGPSIPVGDLGVVTTGTSTDTHAIKATVPSIHHSSRTASIPKTSRAATPSRQSALKSTAHVSASNLSKRPRVSTGNSLGNANKRARSTYANGHDLDDGDCILVKPTM